MKPLTAIMARHAGRDRHGNPLPLRQLVVDERREDWGNNRTRVFVRRADLDARPGQQCFAPEVVLTDSIVEVDTLFDVVPLVTPDHEPEATIDERWHAWSAANPWVMDALERMAAEWISAGHPRVGVKALWEVIRWHYGRTTGSTFKANNDFTSRAARDLIARRPEWASRIETRRLRAA